MMPFRDDLNLGRAYNEAMALVPDDGWACLIDHDMSFTTKQWHAQLVEAITAVPEAGAFTCCANRIGAFWQRAGDPNQYDMGWHYRFGAARRRVRTLLDITETKGLGGVLICLSKAVWHDVGGFVAGLLCVDHQMHFAIAATGRRLYLIEGLYVYHRRRAFDAELPHDTPRALACPCRLGPELEPTRRRVLP